MISDKDQDLKRLFHESRLPDVDLSGEVMSRLCTEQKPKERFIVKRKVSVLVLAGMLLAVSTAVAATNHYVLKNKQGEVVVEEKTLDKSSPDGQAPSLDEQIRSLKSHGLSDDLLKEGTAAVFYLASNNPDHKLNVEYRPTNFDDLAKLRERMAGQPAKLFERIGGSYKFEQATVFFFPTVYEKPMTPQAEAKLAESLRKQAEESNKGYAMMPLEVSPDHWRINGTYKQGEQEIRVSIARIPGKQTILVPENADVNRENLKVKGVDMVYTEFNGEDTGIGGRNIQWVEDVPGSKQAVHYHIETGLQISKEQLIKLAEAYLE
ncbi:hypothetical protein [uncultured Paenibacillus sp.]|uniref:hypothetical protein n=1 Tax=uncultured Paenibacillus sp. TaxID=227322 RepID=UPI0015AF2391|nr:hypothetical protein [uncultured Paenibacillus sp.]